MIRSNDQVNLYTVKIVGNLAILSVQEVDFPLSWNGNGKAAGNWAGHVETALPILASHPPVDA